MANTNERITVTIQNDGKRITASSRISGKERIVIIINNQFTNAPNTTQIASGAGRNSAAGNNAAIGSSNTQQQQSVGAGGKAKNLGMKGKQSEPHTKNGKSKIEKEIVIVINNQIAKRVSKNKTNSAATQVASGSGTNSTSGTNSAIESSNAKQQFAIGGGTGASGVNKGMNSKQQEVGASRNKSAVRQSSKKK